MGDATDSLLGETITSLHIYPARFPTKSGLTDDDLSILVTTASGSVYGKGCNSLVRFYHHHFPMEDDDTETHKSFVKAEGLSGMGLKKIAVGLGFGVGLSKDNEVYLWGEGSRVTDDEAVQMYGTASGPEVSCLIHSKTTIKTCRQHAGIAFPFCEVRSIRGFCGYQSYNPSSLPSSGVHVKVFAQASYALCCSRCGRHCREYDKNGLKGLSYCEACDLLQEVETSTRKPPRKILSDIQDVDCGLGFFCALSNRGELTIWRSDHPYVYGSLISVPQNYSISSFSCGDSFIAAISESGALFAMGHKENKGIQNNSLQRLCLQKVGVPARVMKVHCGKDTIACLLADRSIWLLRKGVEQTFYTFYNQTTEQMIIFKDIIGSVSALDQFFCTDNKSSVFSALMGATGKLGLRGGSQFASLLQAVHGGQGRASIKEGNSNQAELQVDVEQQEHHGVEWQDKGQTPQEPRDQGDLQQHTEKLPSFLRGLYSQKVKSDMTIKMADGEFPGHWLVLSSTSKYFRNLFANHEVPLEILDMSSYNPRAYRALLQYFYQIEPDDLSFDDLVDLFSLAASYEEPAIVKAVSDRLKNHIESSSVLKILTKAKTAGGQELVEECEKFMSSPAYKDWVIASLLQDPARTFL